MNRNKGDIASLFDSNGLRHTIFGPSSRLDLQGTSDDGREALNKIRPTTGIPAGGGGAERQHLIAIVAG